MDIYAKYIRKFCMFALLSCNYLNRDAVRSTKEKPGNSLYYPGLIKTLYSGDISSYQN